MTDTTGTSPRILGALHVVDGVGVVRMEDRYDTDIDDLWEALTVPARLERWLGTVSGDLHVGGAFHAHFFSSGWEGSGRVVACDPPRRLLVATHEHPTAPAEGDVAHTIEVSLRADGTGTLLVWEERGMAPNNIAAYGAGIQTHVEDLAAHIAGGGRCDPDPRFDQLYPLYQQLAAALD